MRFKLCDTKSADKILNPSRSTFMWHMFYRNEIGIFKIFVTKWISPPNLRDVSVKYIKIIELLKCLF